MKKHLWSVNIYAGSCLPWNQRVTVLHTNHQTQRNLRPCSHSKVVILMWERNHLSRPWKKESSDHSSLSMGKKTMILTKFSKGNFQASFVLDKSKPQMKFQRRHYMSLKIMFIMKMLTERRRENTISQTFLMSLMCKMTESGYT